MKQFNLQTGKIGEEIAKDYLERRFGDFGKLFSNVLLLPISLKGVFLVFAVKDIVFYMIWFILPVVLGHGIALAASGLPFLGLPFFFLALSFSFAYGIFSAFFLSVLKAFLLEDYLLFFS